MFMAIDSMLVTAASIKIIMRVCDAESGKTSHNATNMAANLTKYKASVVTVKVKQEDNNNNVLSNATNVANLARYKASLVSNQEKHEVNHGVLSKIAQVKSLCKGADWNWKTSDCCNGIDLNWRSSDCYKDVGECLKQYRERIKPSIGYLRPLKLLGSMPQSAVSLVKSTNFKTASQPEDLSHDGQSDEKNLQGTGTMPSAASGTATGTRVSTAATTATAVTARHGTTAGTSHGTGSVITGLPSVPSICIPGTDSAQGPAMAYWPATLPWGYNNKNRESKATYPQRPSPVRHRRNNCPPDPCTHGFPQDVHTNVPTTIPAQEPQTAYTPDMVPPQTGYIPDVAPPQTGHTPDMGLQQQNGPGSDVDLPQQAAQSPDMILPEQAGQTDQTPDMALPQQTGQMPDTAMTQQTGQIPDASLPYQTGQAPGMAKPQLTGQTPSMALPQQTGQIPDAAIPQQTGRPSKTAEPQIAQVPDTASLQPVPEEAFYPVAAVEKVVVKVPRSQKGKPLGADLDEPIREQMKQTFIELDISSNVGVGEKTAEGEGLQTEKAKTEAGLIKPGGSPATRSEASVKEVAEKPSAAKPAPTEAESRPEVQMPTEAESQPEVQMPAEATAPTKALEPADVTSPADLTPADVKAPANVTTPEKATPVEEERTPTERQVPDGEPTNTEPARGDKKSLAKDKQTVAGISPERTLQSDIRPTGSDGWATNAPYDQETKPKRENIHVVVQILTPRPKQRA